MTPESIAPIAGAVTIPIGPDHISGDLHVPAAAVGLVLFAHGSGSSRFSSRNRDVARGLEQAGLATLLLDLLTPLEEAVDVRTRQYRFDIDRLGRRVVAAIDWVTQRHDLGRLPIGLFGASTGAAAALLAAAERPAQVRAVVSRGGRPDLADAALPRVAAPTLLLVGERDEEVLGLNRDAMKQMTAPVDLTVVPAATHLFEEPGALENVSRLASSWLTKHLLL